MAGFDVVRQAQQLRHVIGLSGQYAAVDENLTGRENLWMFGLLYQLSSAESRRRSDELLEQFDLVDAADRVVKTYSGGMRRRLDLGSALIGRPRLLFLDEPTTGLDPRSRLGMWDVIRSLVREGTTLLLTTQYLEEADELADTIAVVDHGKIIARGTADELKAQVGGERIEVVVRDRERIRGRRPRSSPATASAAFVLDEHTRRLTVPAEGGASTLVTVVRDLGEAGIEVDDVGRPPPDPRRRVPVADRSRVGRGRGRRDGGMTAGVRDSLVVTWRNLKRIPRIPELAIFAVLQSIMFVLLFAVVFGGAILLPGYEDNPNAYREFLMPGIFAQNIVFAAGITAIGITDDVGKGIIDRFRSLPMARSAVLTGRSFGDVVYNLGILIVLMVSGLFVGWAVNTGLGGLLAGVLLALGFAFAMSWLGHLARPQRPDGRGRQPGRLHGPVPDHLPVERLRRGRDPADLAAAGRGVEPDVHPDELAADAVGQPEPGYDRQHPVAVPGPDHDPVDHRVRGSVRPAQRPPLPEHEPLTDAARPVAPGPRPDHRRSSC